MIFPPVAEEVFLRFPQLFACLYVEPCKRLFCFFFAAGMDELQELVIDSLPPLLYWEFFEAQLTAQQDMALGFSATPLAYFRVHLQTREVLQNQIST